MSATAEAPATTVGNGAAKKKAQETVYEKIKMTDGREVEFPGKRQIDKTPLFDPATGKAGVRFDFRNGETLTIWSNELPPETQLQALAHGLAQKCGDEAAGEKDIDDITVAVDDMMKRLRAGEWRVVREAGDSFSGASLVIRAVAEVSGKTAEEVKAFLQKKLDKSKELAAANGTKPLTRAELYASFRDPASPTGQVVARLEAEKRKAAARVSANDLLAEIGA